MTTPAAAALYAAQHAYDHQHHRVAIFNPKHVDVSELPVIYGFNNGGSPGWYNAVLLSEDGVYLGGHCCSDEVYMPADLGILEGTRDDRHVEFKVHYPDGYRMEFVRHRDVHKHAGLMKAIKLAGSTNQ